MKFEVQPEPQVGSEEEERIKEIYKELGLQDRQEGLFSSSLRFSPNLNHPESSPLDPFDSYRYARFFSNLCYNCPSKVSC